MVKDGHATKYCFKKHLGFSQVTFVKGQNVMAVASRLLHAEGIKMLINPFLHCLL